MTTKTLEDGGLIVYSDGSDREQWLGARRGKYTATTVTAIAGSNPYTKLIDVWNDFTDPEYDPEALRNRWLEERAAFGQEREPEIIKWASEATITGGPGNPFIPSSALVGLPELEEFGGVCTPDGYKFAREDGLVLIEAKASQQNWKEDGLPQHIYDQVQWQIYTTGAVTVWIAQDLVKWVGRGANKQATVDESYRYLLPVRRDQARLDFLLRKVDWFKGLLAAGIAPESDVDLRELAEPDFDSTVEDIAAWEEAVKVDELLTELAEIRARMAVDAKRDEAIVAEVKSVIKEYEGRRIWLIGTRFIAKLARGTRTTLATKDLPAETLRSITGWADSETVKFEINPEYVATKTESE
jgi:hypothetical protein